jgi:hypothetical protein
MELWAVLLSVTLGLAVGALVTWAICRQANGRLSSELAQALASLKEKSEELRVAKSDLEACKSNLLFKWNP